MTLLLISHFTSFANKEEKIKEYIDILKKEINSFKTDKKEYQMTNRTITNFFEMKENNMIIMGHGGVSYFVGMFNKNNVLTEFKITYKTYTGVMQINDKIA